MKMNKHIELPITEPMYGTYHHQGPATAIDVNGNAAKNWCLNQAVNLMCGRRFLNGLTTPELSVPGTSLLGTPYMEYITVPTRFTGGYINFIIKKMLDNGYYVYFESVDDYYVTGKSWYRERHFIHNGLICGYDSDDKTYCIYAYDKNWIYQKFWTPQNAFDAGRRSAEKQGKFGNICAVKIKDEDVKISVETIYSKLKQYLDSDIEKYPFQAEGNVYGIAVLTYISEYVMRLYREVIPYERMDRRIFRLIWEHKKVMLERIIKIEETLNFDNKLSEKYRPLVKEADTMRMLYASHHMKRRDSVLPIISEKLLRLQKNEREILTELVEKMGKVLENNAVGISEKQNTK